MCTHVFTLTHRHAHVCSHSRRQTQRHAHMRVHRLAHTRRRAHMFTHRDMHMCTCTDMHTRTQTSTCVFTLTHRLAHVCAQKAHTHTHIGTDTHRHRHTRIRPHTHTCTQSHRYAHIHRHARIYIQTHRHTDGNTCVHTHRHMLTYMHTHTGIHTRTLHLPLSQPWAGSWTSQAGSCPASHEAGYFCQGRVPYSPDHAETDPRSQATNRIPPPPPRPRDNHRPRVAGPKKGQGPHQAMPFIGHTWKDNLGHTLKPRPPGQDPRLHHLAVLPFVEPHPSRTCPQGHIPPGRALEATHSHTDPWDTHR